MAAHLLEKLPSTVGPTRDPSRAGAVWVAGTGAFLLLVAAAVFVASNWDQIPPPAKLAAVGLLTGVFLVAGRATRTTLPATSGALSHLGAFLIPVDVAALAIHLEAAPEVIALAEGVVGAVAFWWLDRTQSSALLRWAATASIVVAAVGLGGVTGVPAGVLLAAAAVVGLATGARRAAIAWALVAGTAPFLAGWSADGALADLLDALALTGEPAQWSAIVTGLTAAGVLAIEARRRAEPGLAVLAVGVAAAGVGTSWSATDPTADANVVALAGLVLLAEVVTLLLRHDRFWGGISGVVATVAEVAATGFAIVGAGAVLLAAVGDVSTAPGLVGPGAAVGLTAVTWLLADLRRRVDDAQPLALALLLGGGFAPATIGAAVCAAGAVALLAGSMATAIALAALAGLLVCSGRPLGHVTAAAFVALAPPAATSEPAVVAVLGVAGGLLLAWAAILRTSGPVVDRAQLDAVWLLALASCVPVGMAALVLSTDVDLGLVLVGAVATLWGIGVLLDEADRQPGLRGLGTVPRAASLAALLVAPAVAGGWVVAALLAVLGAEEAVRRRDPVIAATLAISLPAATLLGGLAAGITPADIGLLLVAAAAAPTAVALLGSERWLIVSATTAITCCTFGVLLASGDPAATASLLLVAGAAGLGFGVLDRQPVVAWGGAAVFAAGVEAHLALQAVAASEAYLAPVAALLLAVGYAARRRDPGAVGSWIAYGPAVALLGGAALLERVAGGSPTHALVAGIVGVVAVGIGGWRRLAAPIFLGTALLIGVAGYESLAVTTALPTWVWLATGGTFLLAIGIVLERTETGPLEGGRRLVEVIGHRFD